MYNASLFIMYQLAGIYNVSMFIMSSLSHRVPKGNVSIDVGQHIFPCFSVSFPPHELIKIGSKLRAMAPSHSLDLHLYPIPVGFNVVGVLSSGSDKLYRVVDGAMSLNRWQSDDSVVCSPTVRIYCGSRIHMGLNNGQQCGSIPGID